MPFTLTMPKLSPTMEEGTIIKWHKKTNDFIEAGDIVIEVATDKAVVEFNAIDSGWLRQIIVSEGKDAIVNQAIAIMSENKEESLEGYQPEGAKAAIKEKETPSKVETPSENIKEPLFPQSPSREAGLTQPHFAPEPPLENYEFEWPSESIQKRIKASPLAKKIAKEKKLDLSTVKGTGPNQRIMSRDLERAQASSTVTFGHREAPQITPGSYEEESLTPMRKAIAQRLQEAKAFIPHFYITQTVNARALFDIREQLRQFNLKITYNDFVIKACALALREHPKVNSGFDSVKNNIIKFKTIDISVAVSLESGLITPILRHADFKNLGEISTEVRALASRAKENKLNPEEYKGGSFTISNLGMFGITEFQAILNPPQSAILAVGGLLEVPVVQNGQVVPGKTMNITLSCDHRVVDGAAGAEFLKSVQKYLENPSILLL